ncbi:aminotransferase class I/II-fold pyridoxal phosphate-dependent enzyme [Psychroflexus planctonicus]|uniref:8-amino-7-oxononanoate synthase n=1 Tax=Psychroflexus planctonicus TaxID=1526575 RepID=A0ABQ1SIH4_9FLAO|nr:pyridoxal phosphate-dependent aminotransferase family protein [Psychroflexus planctonicus]GGE38565.1 8-amino-7-oxononanoate synthase [Psychroflexus planctonicus]
MKEKKPKKTNGNFPTNLYEALENRKQNANLRKLPSHFPKYDFSSNDYLGFAKAKNIAEKASEIVTDAQTNINSATSSRLIRGNYPLIEEAEQILATFYEAESALIFNSGYLANLGLLSCINTKNTLVFYDELAHASIRDGLQLSLGKAYKFKHNDVSDLAEKIQLQQKRNSEATIYIITEAIFSMDGDGPNLNKLLQLCKENNCYLIIDEAHSNPMYPLKNLLSEYNLNNVFARIVTFGKGFGVHGAAVLGSEQLKSYLVNFSRSFIYTTATSPHSIASILAAHQHFEEDKNQLSFLKENISQFRSVMHQLKLEKHFLESYTQIQSCLISGNDRVSKAAEFLQVKEFDVRAIKSPTVPEGKERLRFCIHSYNNPSEIEAVLKNLALYFSK